MSEQKNKIDNTFATKVARRGSRSNSGFKNSSICNKHHGKRGNKTSKNPFKKRLLCTDHAAHKWGFEHICCSKGARCGFAHSIAQQIVDPENHRFNKIIRNAVNKSDSTEVSKLNLLDPEIFNHLAKRSKICRRFLSCYDKKSKGTLKKSDICPGGANCKGGICGDSYDFDFTKSLLLDEGDWRYGKPNGVGICLTKYGLIPLVIQKQKAAEKEAQAKAEAEEKRVTQMLTNKDSFPTLGSGASANTSGSSTSWGKVNWKSVASALKEDEEFEKFKAAKAKKEDEKKAAREEEEMKAAREAEVLKAAREDEVLKAAREDEEYYYEEEDDYYYSSYEDEDEDEYDIPSDWEDW